MAGEDEKMHCKLQDYTLKVELNDNRSGSSSASFLNESFPEKHKFGDESTTGSGCPDEFDDMLLRDRLRCLPTSGHLRRKPEILEENSSGRMKENLKFDQKLVSSGTQLETGRAFHAGSSNCNESSSGDTHPASSYSTHSCNSAILNSSISSNMATIKSEPEYDEAQGWRSGTSALSPFMNNANVKSETKTASEDSEDALDHMLLRERMRLLSKNGNCLDIQQNSVSMAEPVPLNFSFGSVGLKRANSQKAKLPRKRRRTATGSIETALEEDAPGLLKSLIERGVVADEIKLYGDLEDHDDSDGLSITEEFSELEEVLEKVFWKRDSFLKFGPSQSAKLEGSSYCLECLLALIEKSRYLRSRKLPVEWGWCRDLLSFIFVFERHNRIVLERPEYGHATYFFELVDLDRLPVDWQIKRLVTVMKLTRCSRIALLENRPLTVGEDLTEGEARVLGEYGWTANTGLGTMLNYYHRVIHDRKNRNDDVSVWTSKMGKLLVDGYNGGRIITDAVAENRIPKSEGIKPEPPD